MPRLRPAIFYDLETSDLSPIGQILNFCFTLVCEQFEVVRQLKGRVKISRLQLPRAGAIKANKIDVLEHQRLAEYDEAGAMCAIRGFLNDAVAEFGEYQAALIGYNSARFDLEYLRTSFIRNGLNPYCKVQHRDLLSVSRKLAASDDAFPLVENPAEPGKRSLRLETLCKAFGLLNGPQLHESAADVHLTIALAKQYASQFGLDVRDYCAYEPIVFDKPKRGLVVERHQPSYELGNASRYTAIPYVLLDCNHRYALWINLERFAELERDGKPLERAVEFFKLEGSEFFCDGTPCAQKSIAAKATRALDTLQSVSLRTFFKESDCDIEAQIMRLDFQSIDALHRRLWLRENNCPLCPEAKPIVARFKLNRAEEGTAGLDERLREYGLYRYGGRMKINRWSKAVYEEGVFLEGFHPSFVELMEEVQALEQVEHNPDDKSLLSNLREFYLRSDIYRVCGKELEQIKRVVPPLLEAESELQPE